MDDSFFIASFRARQAVLRRAVAVGCGLSVRFDERDMEQVRRTAAQTGGGTLIGLYRVDHLGGRMHVTPAG